MSIDSNICLCGSEAKDGMCWECRVPVPFPEGGVVIWNELTKAFVKWTKDAAETHVKNYGRMLPRRNWHVFIGPLPPTFPCESAQGVIVNTDMLYNARRRFGSPGGLVIRRAEKPKHNPETNHYSFRVVGQIRPTRINNKKRKEGEKNKGEILPRRQ